MDLLKKFKITNEVIIKEASLADLIRLASQVYESRPASNFKSYLAFTTPKLLEASQNNISGFADNNFTQWTKTTTGETTYPRHP